MVYIALEINKYRCFGKEQQLTNMIMMKQEFMARAPGNPNFSATLTIIMMIVIIISIIIMRIILCLVFVVLLISNKHHINNDRYCW